MQHSKCSGNCALRLRALKIAGRDSSGGAATDAMMQARKIQQNRVWIWSKLSDGLRKHTGATGPVKDLLVMPQNTSPAHCHV